MMPIEVSMSATLLEAWPDDQLLRVWRLATGAIRVQASTSDSDALAQIALLEPQANALGAELLRRRLI